MYQAGYSLDEVVSRCYTVRTATYELVRTAWARLAKCMISSSFVQENKPGEHSNAGNCGARCREVRLAYGDVARFASRDLHGDAEGSASIAGIRHCDGYIKHLCREGPSCDCLFGLLAVDRQVQGTNVIGSRRSPQIRYQWSSAFPGLPTCLENISLE